MPGDSRRGLRWTRTRYRGALMEEPSPDVPCQQIELAKLPHRVMAVKGKPRPRVLILLPDGTLREPNPGEITYDELAGV